MISIIICSINEVLLNNILQNIKQTIGVPYEVICINNSENRYSISQAYNQGARKAKHPYLCFIHEDILFNTNEWGTKLINHFDNKKIALIGILGSSVKTKAPSGVFIPLQHFYRVNQLQRRKDSGTDHYYSNPLNETYSEVKVVDGMFLATTKSYHSLYPFDEKLLTGFHGYDIDFSLGQSKNGKVVVVYDILIEHFSYGGNTINWINEQLIVTQKWHATLPSYIAFNKRELLEAEIMNTEFFLTALFNNDYKKTVQLEYLLKLIWLRPFALKNFRFAVKLLFNKKLIHKLKKTTAKYLF